MSTESGPSDSALIAAAAVAIEKLLRDRFPVAPYGLPPQQIEIVAIDVAALAKLIAAHAIGAVRSATYGPGA